ncbi:hypothetical protein QC763_0000370 [Podospora pseudopauciseta]|uniref:Uncharacterized protein n=2 Tax=Podospora TaxID=5144 RepID=A0ABR0HWK0_9PEZI|nr:hypothetical protein QC763_0000370 [Podospora pseudopauciseta]KAK4680594.1 hypothetical protein QC764_0000370 [Podospora pseudoanserina]
MRKRSPKRKRKREVPEFAEAPWPTIIGQGLMWVHARNLNWILSQNMLDAVTSRANPLDAGPGNHDMEIDAGCIWPSSSAAGKERSLFALRRYQHSNPDSVRLVKAVVTAGCLVSRHDPVLALDEGAVG